MSIDLDNSHVAELLKVKGDKAKFINKVKAALSNKCQKIPERELNIARQQLAEKKGKTAAPAAR